MVVLAAKVVTSNTSSSTVFTLVHGDRMMIVVVVVVAGVGKGGIGVALVWVRHVLVALIRMQMRLVLISTDAIIVSAVVLTCSSADIALIA